MTIQSAFNEITETLGGTPSTDGTITGAIDALNDTLAGSNQDRGNSIEDAVKLLGEHINVSPTLGVLSAIEIMSGESAIEDVSYETLIGEKRVAVSLGTVEIAIAGGAGVNAYFYAESLPTVSATFGVEDNVQTFTDFEVSYDEEGNTASILFTMPNFDGEDWDAVLRFTCA